MSGYSFPVARNTPLEGGAVLRWGIIGPGEIADAFAATLHRNTGQRITAVASRAPERAAAFAARHDIPMSFASAQELVHSDDVDIVYVATPNAQHLPAALLAIGAGKHVLVEKPLALNAAEGETIARAARKAGVLAAEAMWSAYLPQADVLRQLIDRGDLGEIKVASVDVGWSIGQDPPARFIDEALGGGALLDAGVYAFWFAQYAIGRAVSVVSLGTPHRSGVDEQIGAVIAGREGELATVAATMASQSPGHAWIAGTRAHVRFLDSFVFPARFALSSGGEERIWVDDGDLPGRDGLAWQAVAVAQAIAEGHTDSPVHPIADAVDVLRTLDLVRHQFHSRTHID